MDQKHPNNEGKPVVGGSYRILARRVGGIARPSIVRRGGWAIGVIAQARLRRDGVRILALRDRCESLTTGFLDWDG